MRTNLIHEGEKGIFGPIARFVGLFAWVEMENRWLSNRIKVFVCCQKMAVRNFIAYGF